MPKDPKIHKKNKIPTFMGMFLLLVGVILGVILIKGKQIFRLGADQASYPTNIRVSNISENSVNISWTTDAETHGFVKYGKSSLLYDNTVIPENQDTSTTHYFKIEGLKEGERYYFVINSDGIDYLDEKQPYQFTTANQTTNPNESCVIYGQVFSQNAQPQENAIVYATVGGGSFLSTTTDKNGNWAILVSSARTKNLASYIAVDKQNSLVELEILTNSQNISSITTYPQTAKPLPLVILGNSYDYRQNSPQEVEDYVPISKTSPIIISSE